MCSVKKDPEAKHAPIPNGESSPIFVARLEGVRRREAWVGWTQVMANILVPIAILVAGLSLLHQTLQSQRNTAERQIELFYSEGMSAAQSTLFSLWTDRDLSVLRTPQSREFIDAFVERAIETSAIDSSDIATAIVAITSFFDRVEACISANRCDENEIEVHLGQYGRDFHCIYIGQIASLRQRTLVHQLGDGLKSFAERSGGCS